MTVIAFQELTIEGASFEVRVEQVRVRSAIHEPERVEVVGQAVDERGRSARVDPDAILGSKAWVTLGGDGEERIEGAVCEVAAHDRGAVTVLLAHSITGLSHTLDQRLFIDEDAVAIARTVLGEHELSFDERLERRPPPRPQCVQAFESDLAFVSRILAEEGIAWFVERSGGAARLVLADGPSGFSPIEGDDALPYGGGDGLSQGEAVIAARLRHRLGHDRVTLRDSDFENPALDLTVEAGATDGGCEHYAFLGPRRYRDPALGRVLAQRRLDSLRADTLILDGLTTCPRVAVGRTFVLGGAPREDLGRRWLVVAVDARAGERYLEGGERRFEARFRAVPAERGYRPPIPRAPSIGGVQTATVTGPAGEEIHTDGYGRVTAKLRWDRRRQDDETSSQWMRVLHPPTTGGFMLPRMGWEALVGYAGPSADLPFVLGRLDNGAALTAESLPGQMRRSNFGTPTTPGGGAANMLRLDDGAGGEQVRLDASRNYDEQTANNKATTVDGTEIRVIGSNQELTYESSHSIKVTSPQGIEVGSTRTVAAAGGMIIDAGSETVAVGGLRELTVGGHYSSKIGGSLVRAVGGAKIVVPLAGNNRHTDGVSTLLIGGAWLDTGAASSISVGGMSTLTCAATTITAAKYTLESNGFAETGGARSETAGGSCALEGKSIAMSCGATTITAPLTVVTATSGITVNAGGVTLKIAPGKVSLIGPFNAGGHLRSSGSTSHG